MHLFDFKPTPPLQRQDQSDWHHREQYVGHVPHRSLPRLRPCRGTPLCMAIRLSRLEPEKGILPGFEAELREGGDGGGFGGRAKCESH